MDEHCRWEEETARERIVQLLSLDEAIENEVTNTSKRWLSPGYLHFRRLLLLFFNVSKT